MELGRREIPNNTTALLCHGVLIKYIRYQIQGFHRVALELGCVYQTLRSDRELVELGSLQRGCRQHEKKVESRGGAGGLTHTQNLNFVFKFFFIFRATFFGFGGN